MKKRILFSIAMLANVLRAQSQSVQEQESYAYGTDVVKEQCMNLPIKRTIQGGTIILVDYEGNWTNEMKGAFNYACKLWEENLPTCLPLRIKAVLGTVRSSDKNALSKMVSRSYHNFPEIDPGSTDYLSSSVQMKYVLLREFVQGDNVQFIDSIHTDRFFSEPDITITINKNKVNEFSYSLEETPTDKYDFVTFVLREIARGLGFRCDWKIGKDKTQIVNYGKKMLPFERLIYKSLGTSDSETALKRSTLGTFLLHVPGLEDWSLYAPNIWKDGVSLSYFEPNSNRKLSQLLAPEFNRGMVIRDIADDNYPLIFQNALNWNYALAVGSSSTQVSMLGTTDSLLSYKGVIYLPEYGAKTYTYDNTMNNLSVYTVNGNDNEWIYDTIRPFHYNYNGNNESQIYSGWTLSVLKKDGTWDLLSYLQDEYMPFDEDLSRLKWHCSPEEYARTCDGYLRARITRGHGTPYSYPGTSVRWSMGYLCYYYVIDYLPQKVEQDFEGVVQSPSVQLLSDDYFRDVKIGIKNTEGVERLVVEQLEEGEDYPIRYEVKDFKKGYFIASVDKEYENTFTLVSYNKNGSTRSESLVIQPLEPAKLCSVKLQDNQLYLSKNRKLRAKGLGITYLIKSVNKGLNNIILKGKVLENESTIDVSNLKSGNYVIQCVVNGEKPMSLQFYKP